MPVCLHNLAEVFQVQNATLPPSCPGYNISINLKPGNSPPAFRSYLFSPVKESELLSWVDEQLSRGLIPKSASPAASPIFFVKLEGKANRPVVDYRCLNSVTVCDQFPLPLVDSLMQRLKGKHVFAKVDLKSAVNLVRVAPGEEWKTACRTPFGLFESLVMPFGLANAPACFQRFMQAG